MEDASTLLTIGRVAAAAIPATGAIACPDRNGSFEPRIVEKRQRRVAGLDETIVYLYAQGQSTRAIRHVEASLRRGGLLYAYLGTASVLEEVTAWQARPLDRVYPIVYFDALFVKSREEGSGRSTWRWR